MKQGTLRNKNLKICPLNSVRLPNYFQKIFYSARLFNLACLINRDHRVWISFTFTQPNFFVKCKFPNSYSVTAMIISRIPVLIVCLHIDQAWFQGRGNWRVCALIRIAFIVALYQAWYIQSLLKIWISYWYSKVRSTKGLISSENYWYFFHCPKNMPRSILSFVFWISAGFLLT